MVILSFSLPGEKGTISKSTFNTYTDHPCAGKMQWAQDGLGTDKALLKLLLEGSGVRDTLETNP